MDKLDNQILRELYVKFGDEAAFNPRKLRALLLDMRVSKRMVNLFVDISRIEYFKQFASEITNDPSARERLVYNTENEYAFDKAAVEYGVDCWAYAFTGVEARQVRQAKQETESDGDIWPDETAELVAAALRELMSDGN